MQLFGGGVASLPKAIASAPDLLAAAAAVAPLSTAPQGGLPISGAISRFGKLLGTQLDDWRRDAESEAYLLGAVRVDGLDPDLAAMKSWSRAYRVKKQLRRNMEAGALMRQWEKLVWG